MKLSGYFESGSRFKLSENLNLMQHLNMLRKISGNCKKKFNLKSYVILHYRIVTFYKFENRNEDVSIKTILFKLTSLSSMYAPFLLI